jgi:glutamate N-acetyltransferase/amino-acid N-acetyltransferase
MDLVKSGIKEAASALSTDDEMAMQAIMTTDTKPKRSAIAHSDGWKVGGICKGAGMIAPDMATMLAFITTDAAIEPRVLSGVLSEVVATTFNAITIDGDRSTNDTVLAFANSASGVEPEAGEFTQALHMVCRSLAEQIVADGEGATKFVVVRVRGAKDDEEGQKAARGVAESLLVKTALFGNDPNWGRIAAALGKSGVELDTKKLTISMNGVELLSEGVPTTEETLKRMRGMLKHEPEITIVCDLFRGNATAEMLTTDLSTRYVELNAEYET